MSVRRNSDLRDPFASLPGSVFWFVFFNVRNYVKTKVIQCIPFRTVQCIRAINNAAAVALRRCRSASVDLVFTTSVNAFGAHSTVRTELTCSKSSPIRTRNKRPNSKHVTQTHFHASMYTRQQKTAQLSTPAKSTFSFARRLNIAHWWRYRSEPNLGLFTTSSGIL